MTWQAKPLQPLSQAVGGDLEAEGAEMVHVLLGTPRPATGPGPDEGPQQTFWVLVLTKDGELWQWSPPAKPARLVCRNAVTKQPEVCPKWDLITQDGPFFMVRLRSTSRMRAVAVQLPAADRSMPHMRPRAPF